MKVLMVNTFHHRRGGDATYTLDLTHLLTQAGHDVVPLAMRHPDNLPSTWEQWFVPWIDLRHGTSLFERFQAAGQVLWSPRSVA
ncbi:MAG: hypothetical protein QGG40_17980, partial [Myxococcota bacterium]|nr:hypothetical protein [Myxococcota bacterium]